MLNALDHRINAFPIESSTSRWLIALVLGAFWFQVIAPGSLDPRHTSWTFFSKDMGQHYIGWEFYRNEPFGFPLGKIDNYSYPQGTSLLYTDSIPIAGIFFKAINPLLPDNFQYFGLWLLLCLILQAYFSLLILAKHTSNPVLAVLGVSLILLTPSLFFRVYSHISLASHWLIVWSFVLLFDARERAAGFSWQWPALFCLASAIHLYFVPMLLILFGAALLLAGMHGRKPLSLLSDLAINLILLLTANLLLGNFMIQGKDLNIGGLGYYSMNLNAPLDPLQFSRFLPELPKATEGQYEGFNYLGLGYLVLLASSLLLAIKNIPDHPLRKADFVLLGVCGIFTLVALSNHITLGSRELVVIPLPAFVKHVYGIFRSTGRFFWPVSYLAIFAGIGLVLRRLRPREAMALLSLALLVQLVDFSPLLNQVRKTATYQYETPLHSQFWQLVPQNFSRIVFFPPNVKKFLDTYEPIALLAARNHLKLNIGYVARWEEKQKVRQARQEFRRMLSGQTDTSTLFVIFDLRELARVENDQLVVLQIDGYTVLLTKDHPILKRMPDWQRQVVPAINP